MNSTNLIVLLLTIFATPSHAANLCSKFAVISHRGLSTVLPEESRSAYQASADLGTDYLEMDVHRSKDGVLIVHHDNSFARTTDINKIYPDRINNPIFSFTFNEISKLKNKGAPILKLEEVIDISLTHPHHPGLYIETKSPDLYPGVEKQLVDLLESKNAFKQVKVFFQSFDIDSIKKLKELRPETPRLYLTEEPYSKLIKTELPLAAQFATGIGPNLAEISDQKLGSFLTKVHHLKLIAHFWTVDNPKKMRKLIQAKADGIFTNRTDLLIENCEKLSISEIRKKLIPYLSASKNSI